MTENLQRVIGSRAGAQFRYVNAFGQAETNAVDVLILDEAHRIRETSRDRFRPTLWSGLPQINQFIGAATASISPSKSRVSPTSRSRIVIPATVVEAGVRVFMT